MPACGWNWHYRAPVRDQTAGMQSHVRIRPAVSSDADRLLELWWQLTIDGSAADARYEPRPDARSSARGFIHERWLAEGSTQTALVAEDDNRVVGFIVVRPAESHPVLNLPPTLLITDAVVEPSARRKGTGRSLVAAVRDLARRECFGSIEVGTLALDDRAVAFWRAMGFTDWRVTLSATL